MGKFKDNWKQMLLYEKICFCLGILCASAVLILAVLFFTKTLCLDEEIYVLLLCVLMLMQAGVDWRRSKALSLISAAVAVFLLSVAFFIGS